MREVGTELEGSPIGSSRVRFLSLHLQVGVVREEQEFSSLIHSDGLV